MGCDKSESKKSLSYFHRSHDDALYKLWNLKPAYAEKICILSFHFHNWKLLFYFQWHTAHTWVQLQLNSSTFAYRLTFIFSARVLQKVLRSVKDILKKYPPFCWGLSEFSVISFTTTDRKSERSREGGGERGGEGRCRGCYWSRIPFLALRKVDRSHQVSLAGKCLNLQTSKTWYHWEKLTYYCCFGYSVNTTTRLESNPCVFLVRRAWWAKTARGKMVTKWRGLPGAHTFRVKFLVQKKTAWYHY